MNDSAHPTYRVKRVDQSPLGILDWNGILWNEVTHLDVSHFHALGSPHRPLVQAKMAYDAAGLYGLFRVLDRYVVCTHTGFQNRVYKDSCVEFFVRPKPDKGYLNFEMNCGGHLLCFYIADWRRNPHPKDLDDEFMDRTRIPTEWGSKVRIFHTMPETVAPEIAGDVEWLLAFHIPFALLEHYVGPLGNVSGQEWRANFNKCADESSHPHWGTWSPIGDELNLHQPNKFGVLEFE